MDSLNQFLFSQITFFSLPFLQQLQNDHCSFRCAAAWHTLNDEPEWALWAILISCSSCWSLQTAVIPVVDGRTDWFTIHPLFTHLSCNHADFLSKEKITADHLSDEVRIHGFTPTACAHVFPPEGWIQDKSGFRAVSLKVKLHVSLRVKSDRYVQLEQKERREAWLEQPSGDSRATSAPQMSG